MQSALLTVLHNATRFSNDLIRPDAFAHVYTKGAAEIFDQAEVVITSMRHPLSVWESFWKNDRKPSVFFRCYQLLDGFDQARSILYLPVDRADRDEYLQRIADALDRPLSTDWKPRRGHTTQVVKNDGPAPKIDLSPVFALDCIRRLYGSDQEAEWPESPSAAIPQM